MITFSTYFKDLEELEQFINDNKKIETSKNLLIQIFSGVIEKELLEEISLFLMQKLPNSKIVGSTTDGEILENKVSTGKIVISFTSFDKTTLKVAGLETNSLNSYESGKLLAKELLEKNSKVFILFASGLSINGEEFLNGVHEVSPNIVVAGGLSADNANFLNSYLICNEKVQSSGVVGVSLNSKDLVFENRYSLAWESIGRRFTVNKSLDNRVYEIDGMTPFELYKKYLGEDVAKKLPGIGIEFPLIIQRNNERIARAVIKVHDDGSMTFAGNIRNNSIVRFGIGNIEQLLDGSNELANDISKYNSESIFIYSCMARRRFLDKSAALDINNFSKLSSVVGFFTYGEFFTTECHNEFLNESLTILSLSENLQKKKEEEFKNIRKSSARLLKQKALSHLINMTSEELDYLNSNLAKEVEKKTKENLNHEQYILEQDKLAQMGEMIGNIAHQWRQPLSAISSNASSIIVKEELGVLSGKDVNTSMKSILKKTDFLSETINTFRDFIKEDSIEKKVVIQDRIDIVLDVVLTTLRDCNIKLINNVNYENPIEKKLLIGLLSQVILNIINNAKDVLIERKIEDPWIKIDCECIKENVVITIEDNAGGIPNELVPKIFNPYFTTKDQTQGTGLGLYMSKNIVNKYLLGDIYVENTNNGASFLVKFPVDKETAL